MATGWYNSDSTAKGGRYGPIEYQRRSPAVRVSGQPMENGQKESAIPGVPKELGVLLVVAGIWGVLLPGPIGTPFLIVGGVILWPAAFRRVDQLLREVASSASSPGHDAVEAIGHRSGTALSLASLSMRISAE